MPQPITHYLICEEAVKKCLPDLWNAHSGILGFGSFGPDLFYIKDLAKSKFMHGYSFQELSDTIHWNGSFDCFCTMLDFIKKNQAGLSTDKMKAFLYGFYSHVITDCIFHPFVYRKTLDHWKTHPAPYVTEHKKFEAFIDIYLLTAKEQQYPSYEFQPVVECSGEDDDLLDTDVFMVFNQGLRSVYPQFIEDLKPDEDHPINEAYEDYCRIVKADFFAIGKIHIGSVVRFIQSKINITDLSKMMNEGKKPWIDITNNDSLVYSANEMYYMAVSAGEKLILACEEYLQTGQEIPIKDFFKGKVPGFLNENYNLDTGLPCSLNDDQTNLSGDIVRFQIGTDLLKENYEQISG